MDQDSGNTSVLRRKAGAERDPMESSGITPAKSLRLSAARAADRLYDLRAIVLAVEEDRQSLTELVESVEENWLVLLLEGSGDARGVAMLDPSFLSALIEVQTMGEVTKAEPAARPPTPTDASMSEAYLDRFLSEFEQPFEDSQSEGWACGFRFGLMMEVPQGLSLVLEDVTYRSFTVTVDLASGSKRGALRLVLPADQHRQLSQGGSGSVTDWQDRFRAVVMDVASELDAVLGRVFLPLYTVNQLEVGADIALPNITLNDLHLEMRQATVVAVARLGQMNGYRAVKILDPDQESEAGASISLDAPLQSDVPAAPLDLAKDGPPGMDRGLDPLTSGTDAGLPDLPPTDLADLPDLPELPDLPDLPALDVNENEPA